MDPTEITAEYYVRLANNGTNITLYGYDRAGQLTNEVLLTNGMAGFRTNAWQYDEAGNWLHSPGENRWRMNNQDNELPGTAAVTRQSVRPNRALEQGPRTTAFAPGRRCVGTSRGGDEHGSTSLLLMRRCTAGDSDLQVTADYQQ